MEKLNPQPAPNNSTANPIPQVPITNIDTLLSWDSPENNRHNVRVLCDLSGLDLHDKNIITACVEQESDFYNYMPVTGLPVKHVNLARDGSIASTDWGIVQINDHYHIGEGEDFPSVDYVMQHPQKCVQFMINCYKQGVLYLWSSYKTGAYLKYMPQ